MQDQEQLKSEEILEEIRRLNGSIKIRRSPVRSTGLKRSRAGFLNTRAILRSRTGSFVLFWIIIFLPREMLRKYRDLERQEVRGENIGTTMRKIEEMMDKVTAGFEKQLDNLYQNDMLDITSDIAAMEQMMVKDGLSDDGELKF